MLSRVADSVYWMSRLVERAENVARFIGVNLHLSLDTPSGYGGDTAEGEQWMPLVVTSGDAGLFHEIYGEPTRENVVRFLALDERNPNSVLACLTAARENARTIRECISSEMWEHLNRFYLFVRECAAGRGELDPTAEPGDFFERVRQAGQQFQGVTDATMSHGEAWQFARLGRCLERADKTSRILDVKYYILLPTPQDVGSPFDELQWAALLRSAGGLEMYRQTHGRINPTEVVEFLILDREFPRAVLHCLCSADDALHAIGGTTAGSFHNRAEQRLGRLRGDLAFRRADEIVSEGVHEFIESLQTDLNAVGGAVFDTFFALRPAA